MSNKTETAIMSWKYRSLGAITMVLCLFTGLCHAISDGWHWIPYQGITGVGSIIKDSPTSTSDLHYGGPSGYNPEHADFHVSYNNPTDLDQRVCYEDDVIIAWGVIEDFGLDTPPNKETWQASAGTITNTGYYTAPSSINNAITIEVWVNDGPGGYDGETAHREWTFLKAYKVGVKIMPANYTYWESSSATSKIWTAAPANDLNVSTGTTRWGKTGSEASAPGWDFDCGWTTKTDPAGCNIIGTIKFNAKIQAYGWVSFYTWGDYVGSSGDGGSVVTELLAEIGSLDPPIPYVSPAANVLTTLGAGNCCVRVGFAFETAVKYYDKGGVEWTKEWFTCIDHDEEDALPMGSVSKSGANISPLISEKEGYTAIGEAKANARVSVTDDTTLYFGYAKSKAVGTIHPDLEYGATRPYY